jgi:hypothetical protein
MAALDKKALDEMMVKHRAYRDQPINEGAPSGQTGQLISGIIKAVAPHLYALEQKIDALLARVAELESSSLKYMGAHQPSIAYRKGDVVSYAGSAWCATRDVSVERPGHGDGFQMMIKSGEASSSHSEAAKARPRQNGHYANPRPKASP